MRCRIILVLLAALCLLVSVAAAQETQTNPLVISLEKPVHFTGSDGNDIVAAPGAYQVEQMEETTLRLVPVGEGESNRSALTIQAIAVPHAETLSVPVALSFSEGKDEHHVVLLLPDSKGLDAQGSYSGVRSRALRRPISPTVIRQQVVRIPAIRPIVGIQPAIPGIVKPPISIRPDTVTAPSQALADLKSRTMALKIEFPSVATATMLGQQLDNALARRPQAPTTFQRFPIVARPLTSANLNLLASFIGKRINYEDLMKLGLTREQVIGLSFTALNMQSYNQAKEEYQRLLAVTQNPVIKQQLTTLWNQWSSGFVAMFKSYGLTTVTEATVATWSSNLKVSPVRTQLEHIMVTAAPSITTIENSAGVAVAPSSNSEATTDEGTSDHDICSQPLASGALLDYSYYVSYDWTEDIPYPCPTWRKPWKICWKTVTLFTFELNVEISIGYEITCTGGSAWAYGDASTTLYDLTMSCSVGGTAVIGAAETREGNSCKYGFGITAHIGCQILGISFGGDYPVAGLLVTAPCPDNLSGDNLAEALKNVMQAQAGQIPNTQIVGNIPYLAYQSYFAYVGSGVTTYGLQEYIIARLAPHYGETLLREVRIGASHYTSGDNAMTDCKTTYFPSGSGVIALLKGGNIFDKGSDDNFTHERELKWLTHELQHARQCEDIGGRPMYAERWFGELGWTVCRELITDPSSVSAKSIHNSMPMEAEAEQKAIQVLDALKRVP